MDERNKKTRYIREKVNLEEKMMSRAMNPHMRDNEEINKRGRTPLLCRTFCIRFYVDRLQGEREKDALFLE